MEETQRYDTSRDMKTIKTRSGPVAYLGVKGRVAWLRTEHPEARIETEKIDGGIEAGWVEFKCTISVMTGITHGSEGPAFEAVAVGHASETQQDFPDFYEKAETKAIGRACAALGYGTEGARDFDDGEPLDGAAASKGERADRRMEPQERAAVDAQHQRNTQPAPSSLPVTRSPAGQRQQPDGQDRARAKVEETCHAKGVPVPDGASYETIAEAVNKALFAAHKDIEVATDAKGNATPGAILNALLALPAAQRAPAVTAQ